MRSRCLYDGNISWHNYGGRGIKICSWYLQSFQNFFSDLGYRPSPKHSVDRIDNDLNYSCGKCEECIQNGCKMNIRWATKKQQVGNMRVNVWREYNGEKMILADWAIKLKVKRRTFYNFIKRGNSIEDAVLYYSSSRRVAVIYQ